jgi:hypothetical protein
MPGDATPINLANALSVPPGDVPGCLLKREGERIEVGEVLARTKGMFGYFKTEYKAKVAGTIETVSAVTGQVIVRGEPIVVQVRAFLAGEIMEVLPGEGVVIEADVGYIQGIFGIGGEAFGTIRLACTDHEQELTADRITPDMKGAIVIGGGRMTGEAVRKARSIGAAAVVSGGMDDQDLKEILGYDLGVAITGSETVGLTVVITEGFGEIAMAERTFQLLKSHEGDAAAVNGATQIRAGVMRPEIVIPLVQDATSREAGRAGSVSDRRDSPSTHTAGYLDIGAPVRIIRDPHFGLIGRVRDLLPEPQVLPSGSKARVLIVEVDGNKAVTVPRANVELIEE